MWVFILCLCVCPSVHVSVCLCVVVSVGTLFVCLDLDDNCKNISIFIVIGWT